MNEEKIGEDVAAVGLHALKMPVSLRCERQVEGEDQEDDGDAQGIDAETAANHERHEEFFVALLLVLPLKRKHQDQRSMHEKKHHSQSAHDREIQRTESGYLMEKGEMVEKNE